LEAASEFDHVVVNRDHDVEGVVREIIDIVNQERLNRGPLTL